MPGGAVAQNVASQIEWVKPELELMYLTASRLMKHIEENTEVKAVSTRPVRVPLEVLAGGKPGAFNPDGGPLKRGSAPTEVFGNISCTPISQASEYTALSEWSTDSDDSDGKAVKNYVTLTNQRATETIAGVLDALVATGGGANVLDTVVSTTTNGLVMNNANEFMDNQDIDLYSSLTGSSGFIATVTIESVDIYNNTIWLTGPVPAGVGAGTYCVLSGSAGVQNSGIYGILYYQASGNAGSVLNINRSTYPGKLSTPGISVNGALVPSTVRAMEMIIKLGVGIERAEQSDLTVHCGLDMQSAWENNAILVQHVIANEVKGDEHTDMLKPNPPTMLGGRKILANERALPGRIDFLALKKWSRIETKPMDYYEVGGQTLFPAYAIDGSVATSMMFWLVLLVNILNINPRMGGFLANLSIPRFLFGH
jgi:hypothetical protein